MKNPYAIYEIEIIQCYSNYIKFIGNNKLPKFKIKWHNGRKEKLDYLAKFDTLNLYNKTYILHFDVILFVIIKKEERASILFHEFTHLVDSLRFLSEEYVIFENIMQIYSEYHASQVQLKKQLNFINENENQMVNLADKVFHYDNQLTVEEFILKMIQKCSDRFNLLSTSPDPENYVSDMTSVFYFLGFISISDNTNTTFSVKLEELPMLIKEPIKDIYDLLKVNNFHACIEKYKQIEDLYFDLFVRARYREQYTISQLSDEDLQRITHKNHEELIIEIIH